MISVLQLRTINMIETIGIGSIFHCLGNLTSIMLLTFRENQSLKCISNISEIHKIAVSGIKVDSVHIKYFNS